MVTKSDRLQTQTDTLTPYHMAFLDVIAAAEDGTTTLCMVQKGKAG